MIEKCSGQFIPWWKSARREVKAMLALLPVMTLDAGAKLPATLFATDAMGASEADAGGYGIVAAEVGADMMRIVLDTSTSPGRTISRLSGDYSGLRDPSKEIKANKPFTLLPPKLFDDACTVWQPMDHGRWIFSDHITLGESRAVLKLLFLLSTEPSAHRHLITSLQDNMATSGAFSKGRSSAPALNFLLRKRCAVSIAAQLKLLLPWVETHVMPADQLSRELEL
jgi:hypothetical protein